MGFWGVVFLFVTLSVALIKTEKPVPQEDEPEDIPTAYGQMFSMLRLRAVRSLCVVLFTWKAAFAVMDSVAPLKFQEYGMPKEHMAYMTSLIMPVYILLPVFAAKWTTGKTPLDLAMSAYPIRVALVALTAGVAYYTPSSMTPTPYAFYGAVFAVGAAGAVVSEIIFVSQMSFFARVSDPALGGTYMTLLNTLGNLGGKWPPTVTFYLVDALTCKEPTCAVQADGFYIVAALCTVVGIVWYLIGAPVVQRMQQWKLEDWRVR